VGHFLLSVDDRLCAAGLSKDRTFALPITQEVLADYLGLSIVHINRTLQQLKREGLIERQGSLVTLKDREALAEICHYTRSDPRRRHCA
jgi:CRP-like cAMP-binding protein